MNNPDLGTKLEVPNFDNSDQFTAETRKVIKQLKELTEDHENKVRLESYLEDLKLKHWYFLKKHPQESSGMGEVISCLILTPINIIVGIIYF